MKRQKVVILGGGMIGSAIAMDLSRRGQADVTVADLRADVRERIESRYAVKTVAADLSRPAAITALVEGYDLVVGALPSVLGYQTLEAVIAAGKDYCDISFMPENALELDARAREKGVCAVVDCGVAPGVSNVMAGYAAAHLAPFESLEIYVGGLPRVRRWPFDYKAGFAPFDVIEEYTRPARIVEHGRVVVREALSEAERMDFPGVGTLEAFNTDGLRSLVHTLDVPFMKEKTLRYPGHIELMRAFRELGLFSKDALKVGEATVRPLDVTAALLFPKWTFEEGEADLTVMRVIAQGLENGRPTRYVWDLLDRFDPETGLRSMSRTTAFPAAIMAGLMLEGGFRRPGVHAPESVGREPGLLDRLLAELEDRGVVCRQSVAVEEPAAAAVA
ncbi:MAG TPA: saccharopine dehydrogenase family protein [Vicinamibacteria bacterium]|nr:saccharopine dehydrogenase family protein [Vicinamibacteria bacterium]